MKNILGYLYDNKKINWEKNVNPLTLWEEYYQTVAFDVLCLLSYDW